ncbi:MAG: ABC transporter permease [Candidatus Omnitrophota bacterium]|nr:ABC transporter permease [Candidatus Omnitrophota bacterium]
MKNLKKHLNLFLVLSRMHIISSDYRSFLGALWSFAGPLLSLGVLYFIFIDRFGRQIPHFPLRLLIGIVLLSSFKLVVQVVMQAVSANRDVIINSLTPPLVIVLSAVSVPFLKFIVEITVCIALAVFAGIFPFRNIFSLLGLSVFFFLLSLGVGFILAILYSFATDVLEIWNSISPILFFVCPIFYTLNMLSPWGRNLAYTLNPLTPFMICFQTLILGVQEPHLTSATYLHALLWALSLFLIGLFLSKKFEKQILEYL